jgi:hypothetical protein
VTPPSEALLTPEAINAWVARATTERRPLIEQCHRQFKDRQWNASSVALGVAPVWHSPTGEWGAFRSGGAAVWMSVAFALSRTEQFESPAGGTVAVRRAIGQAVLQGRYRSNELVPNKNVRGSYFEQDSAGLGARVLLGSADRAAVVEAEFARQMAENEDARTAVKLSVGGQIKLAPDVWLSLALGANRGGSANEQRSAFVLTSFKWALAREPSLRF